MKYPPPLCKNIMNLPKIIIIHQEPFGYHSDTYYYCKYLRNKYLITYICWDYNKKKIYMDNINIIYISRKGNLLLRNFRFITRVLNELKNTYDYHIIKYFRGCSLVKLFLNDKFFLLDIRSRSTLKNKFSRNFYNFLLKTEASYFNNISIISKGLSKRLNFSKNPNKRRVYILPLGAEVISPTTKDFNTINLLYVGTLYNRNIDQTIKGFSKFYHEYKNKLQITYTIIGSGFGTEENDLKKTIKNEGINHVAHVIGYIPHDELKPFFDTHNIGISYIPMTDYFDVQPPTKTFEYLLSGMPVIATATSENKTVINDKNGIVINDTHLAFYQGLVQLYKKKSTFNSTAIRNNAMQYSWEKITNNLSLILQSSNK